MEKIKRSKTHSITLIAIGIFLIGAALLVPLLISGQRAAIASVSGYARLPVTAQSPAPQLALTDLQGNPVSLETYRGRVALVNNWATWCPPCKAEMPELQAYYENHASADFVIIAIESGEPADQVTDFVQSYGLTFPVWLDPKGAALEAFQNWDLPSSYIIDRDGTVLMSWTGQINQATLEKYVTPLLEK